MRLGQSPYLVLGMFLGVPVGGLVFALTGMDGTAEPYLALAGWSTIMLAFVSFWSLVVRRAWPWMQSAGRPGR